VLSPRGAAAVHPWDKATFKAIYSQAFRAPTWAETILANHLVAPSESVKPETVRSIEGSFEQRVGAQRLILALFKTHWDRIIRPAPLTPQARVALQNNGTLPTLVGNVEQFGAAGSMDNFGFSGGWDGSFGQNHVRYGVSLTETYTRLNTAAGAEELAIAPLFVGNLHIAYVPGGYFPTPALAASFIGARPSNRTYPDGSLFPEGAPVGDLRLTFTGALPLKGLSYRASAEYLTSSTSAYAAGPELSWLAGDQAGPPVAVPVDQYRAFVGLRYDFLTGEGEAQ